MTEEEFLEKYIDIIEKYKHDFFDYFYIYYSDASFLKFLKSHGPVLQKDVSELFGLEGFGHKIGSKIHKLAKVEKVIREKQGKTYLIHINDLIK